MWRVTFKGLITKEILYAESAEYNSHNVLVMKKFHKLSTFKEPQLIAIEEKSYERYKIANQAHIHAFNIVDVIEFDTDKPEGKIRIIK